MANRNVGMAQGFSRCVDPRPMMRVAATRRLFVDNSGINRNSLEVLIGSC